MIKVLFVAHDSGPFGAQKTLLTLLERINRQQFACWVAVPGPGVFVDAVQALGHACVQTPRVRWAPEAGQVAREGRLSWIRRFFRGLVQRRDVLTAMIRQHGIDVVYSNTAVTVEGALAARSAGVSHVWHIHEPIVGNPELGPLFPRWLYESAIGRWSSQVVFCSRSVAVTFPQLARRATVVHNGLPLPAVPDRQRARAFLAEHYGVTVGRPVIAVVGAIQPRKDHPTFIRAARQLHESHPDAVFIIAGSDATGGLPALQAQIAAAGLTPHFRVIGWWPHAIHELMAGIDVAVVSSIQESFGLTVLEAYAAGTPVVSTRCGGPEEIIREGIDGHLVPVGDAQALATKVGALLADPVRAAQFAASGRQNFEQQFTVEAYVGSLEACIRQAATLSNSDRLPLKAHEA